MAFRLAVAVSPRPAPFGPTGHGAQLARNLRTSDLHRRVPDGYLVNETIAVASVATAMLRTVASAACDRGPQVPQFVLDLVGSCDRL